MRRRRRITRAEGPPVLVQSETFVSNIEPFVVLAQSSLHIGIVHDGEVQAVLMSSAEYKRLVKKTAELPASRRSQKKE